MGYIDSAVKAFDAPKVSTGQRLFVEETDKSGPDTMYTWVILENSARFMCPESDPEKAIQLYQVAKREKYNTSVNKLVTNIVAVIAYLAIKSMDQIAKTSCQICNADAQRACECDIKDVSIILYCV